VPASAAGTYAFFLVALFVMACGQGFLEVAANRYVTILGPGDSSEPRLNLAQSFNAVGAVCAMLLGLFILSGKEITPEQRAAFSSLQEQAYRTAQASSVRLPYAMIACIFVVVAVLIVTMHLPEVSEKGTETGIDERASWKKVLQQGHLVKGVLAQFLYVGAQVGGGSFVIRFAQDSLPGLTARSVWYYLLGHWIGFMLGRFGGSALMKSIPAPRPLDLRSWLVNFNNRRSLGEWSRIRLGPCADRLFPLHHVPHDFCAQHQEARPIDQTRLFSPGHGDSRRRNSPGNHGTHLRRHKHPHRIRCPTGLLRLHFLLRRMWLQAQQ
jgi:hypothetical protein